MLNQIGPCLSLADIVIVFLSDIHIYIFIYICACVFIFMSSLVILLSFLFPKYTHIYTFMYGYVRVCLHLCIGKERGGGQ